MLRKKEWLSGALVVSLAMVFASMATAQNPPMSITDVANHSQVGAVTAAPYFTNSTAGEVVFTAMLVTNTLNSDARMHVHVIDGDEAGGWGEQDFFCGITPNETTLILFVDDGGGPEIRIECSDTVGVEIGPGGTVLAGLVDGQAGTLNKSQTIDGSRGIVVITEVALNDTNTTITTNNRFIHDWTTVDVSAGSAYSAEALHFQAVVPAPAGPAGTDGAIQFGGVGGEVSSFPSVLGADFFAPTPDGEIVTELILITLDGREGEAPRQRVDGWVYNDDEVKTSWPAREWECMDVFSLTDLNASFFSDQLCDAAPLGCVGHVVLNSRDVVVDFSSHDEPLGGYGDGNQKRQSAFDGYIIHRFNSSAATAPELVAGVAGLANKAATVRLLNRGTNAFVALGTDQVVLDLR